MFRDRPNKAKVLTVFFAFVVAGSKLMFADAAAAADMRTIQCPDTWPKDKTAKLAFADINWGGESSSAIPDGDDTHDVWNYDEYDLKSDYIQTFIYCYYRPSRNLGLVITLPSKSPGTCEGRPPLAALKAKSAYHFSCRFPLDIGEPQTRILETLDANADLRGFRLRQTQIQIRAIAELKKWTIFRTMSDELDMRDDEGWIVKIVFSEKTGLSDLIALVVPKGQPSLEQELFLRFGHIQAHPPLPPESYRGDSDDGFKSLHWNRGHGVSLSYYEAPHKDSFARLTDLRSVYVGLPAEIRER